MIFFVEVLGEVVYCFDSSKASRQPRSAGGIVPQNFRLTHSVVNETPTKGGIYFGIICRLSGRRNNQCRQWNNQCCGQKSMLHAFPHLCIGCYGHAFPTRTKNTDCCPVLPIPMPREIPERSKGGQTSSQSSRGTVSGLRYASSFAPRTQCSAPCPRPFPCPPSSWFVRLKLSGGVERGRSGETGQHNSF